jgi:hypothetical protein
MNGFGMTRNEKLARARVWNNTTTLRPSPSSLLLPFVPKGGPQRRRAYVRALHNDTSAHTHARKPKKQEKEERKKKKNTPLCARSDPPPPSLPFPSLPLRQPHVPRSSIVTNTTHPHTHHQEENT